MKWNNYFRYHFEREHSFQVQLTKRIIAFDSSRVVCNSLYWSAQARILPREIEWKLNEPVLAWTEHTHN